MNRTVAPLAFIFLVSSCASYKVDQPLSGTWTLRINGPEGKEMSVATIRFTDKVGISCMGGKWNGVDVLSIQSNESNFFPLKDSLSYHLDGSELTLGRNGVCDGYRQLVGKLEGEDAYGADVSFGLRGGQDRGTFTLKRNPWWQR
jgi:hypothetical protein